MSDAVPEICSCAALRQAARHLTKFYDAALAPAGLGLNQYAILAKLRRFGPLTIQSLATLLIMDRSTLGHLLRPLEKRGLVRLEISTTDRRSRAVALTAAGETLMRAAQPLWAKAERRFERSFGGAAALDLRTTLKRIATSDLAVVASAKTVSQDSAQGG